MVMVMVDVKRNLSCWIWECEVLVYLNGNGVGMRRFFGVEEGIFLFRMDGKGEIFRCGWREKGVEVGSVGFYFVI